MVAAVQRALLCHDVVGEGASPGRYVAGCGRRLGLSALWVLAIPKTRQQGDQHGLRVGVAAMAPEQRPLAGPRSTVCQPLATIRDIAGSTPCLRYARNPAMSNTISVSAAADMPAVAIQVRTLLSQPLTLPAINRRSPPSMTICSIRGGATRPLITAA